MTSPGKVYRFNPIPTTSSANLYQALYYYLPASVFSQFSDLSTDPLDNVSIEDYVRPLFNQSSMERYHSPERLANNLKVYMTFPGSHRYFGTNDSAPMNETIPGPFQSTRGGWFIEKKGLFVHLQNMMLEKCKEMMQDELVRAIFLAYMKIDEEVFADMCEFVPVDSDIFFSIESNLDAFLADKKSLITSDNHLMPRDWSQATILNSISILLSRDARKCEGIVSLLDKRCKEKHPRRFRNEYVNILRLANRLRVLSERIKSKAIRLFCGNPSAISDRHHTLRLFEDGESQFATVLELKNLIDHQFLRGKSEMSTVDVKDVLKILKTLLNCDGFHIIRIPVIRTEHRSVQIQVSGEGYKKLAADSFFEMIASAIFGSNIFQRIGKSEWAQFVKSMEVLDRTEFMSKETRIYFMDPCMFDLGPFSKVQIRPVNQIRTVGPKGFTVEDLKNELVHLKLPNCFPNILDYAELVYNYVAEGEDILKTGDLYDAVWHCQLICLVERLPKIQKFLHNQQACHRVLHKTCCDKNTAPKIRVAQIMEAPEQPEDSHPSEAPEPEANLSDASPSEHSQSEASISKKKKKQKNKKPKQKTAGEDDKESISLEPTPAPEAPEKSVECTKCNRTNEYHEDAKKELEAVSEENQKKKERLAYLEGQGEGKKSREKLNKELEEARKMLLELERENRALEEFDVVAKRRLPALEAEVASMQSEIQRNSELSEQQDVCIRLLKEHIPEEIILGYKETVRHTSVIRGILTQYWAAHNSLRGTLISEAEDKMHKLKNLKPPADVLSRARYYVDDFEIKCTNVGDIVANVLNKIQSDMFITPAEVPPLPEVPVLSAHVDQIIAAAQEEANQREANTCIVCGYLVRDDEKSWTCPQCALKLHLKCQMEWLTKSGNNTCMHCSVVLN